MLPFSWAPSGRCGGVAEILGSVWLPWGRSRSPWPPLATVGAWLVSRVTSRRRGGVPDLLSPAWLPSGRGLSCWCHLASLGVVPVPGPRLPTVGTWPVPCALFECRGPWPVPRAPSGRHEDVAGPPDPVWQPWGRGPVSWAPSGCR